MEDYPSKPKVLLFGELHPLMEQHLTDFHFLKPWESSESLLDFLSTHSDEIKVILCSGPVLIDATRIAMLPKLESVISTSKGVDMIDLEVCQARGIAVTNAGTVFSDDAADFVVGFVLNLFRRISVADSYVRGGMWTVSSSKYAGEFPLGSTVGGKRIGILGLGSIGSETARRLEAFGCRISYYSRKRKTSVPSSYTYFSDVCELAAQVDVLVVSCALNSETKNIVNKKVLEALGKQGFVINVGRGMLIDEKELVRCLKNGEIADAGLDVFENEPFVPPELYEMDNVVLSPHSSVLTEESLSEIGELARANLEAFFSGKPLPFRVV